MSTPLARASSAMLMPLASITTELFTISIMADLQGFAGRWRDAGLASLRRGQFEAKGYEHKASAALHPFLEAAVLKDVPDSAQHVGQGHIPEQTQTRHDAAQSEKLRGKRCVGIHELGEESQKNQYSLGIQRIGQKALAEEVQPLLQGQALRRQGGIRLLHGFDHSCTYRLASTLSGAYGLNAQPDQIGRPHIFEDAEPQHGLRDDGRNAQHGRRGVHTDAKGHAHSGGLPLWTPIHE